MSFSNVGTYIKSHWQGRQSLGRSLWLNFVLPRVVLFALEGAVLPLFPERPAVSIAISLTYFLLADGLFLLWQVVGLLRACDRHITALGSMAMVWAAHAGLVVALIFIGASLFSVYQKTGIDPDAEILSEKWARERAAKYALTLSEDGGLVHLTGSFELGITESLRNFLAANPGVTGIVLQSAGGNIFEARGVAKVVMERDLDSYVYADCSSACTTAFIAGARRRLGPRGRLGFHGYALDASYQVPGLDIEKEQNKDRALYRARGISDAFLERVFEAGQSDLWVPAAPYLLEAGVVHEILAQESNR